MVNPVRRYDWGSRTALATLQGRPPTGEPEAELWMGAHPLAPSHLLTGDDAAPGVEPGVGPDAGPDAGVAPAAAGISLAAAIATDPAGVLGEATLRRFGARLPFLLKVLAVERALSVQVHPGRRRAAARFAEEAELGLAPGSAKRTYVDPYGKPEFLYALTAFDALAGLRPAQEAKVLLSLLGLPVLDDAVAAAGGPGQGRAGAAAALAQLVRMPDPARAAFADDAARRAAQSLAGSAELPAGARDALAVVVRLAAEHPGDALVVAPLLLRLHHLCPGGTIFLPTGVPHAYLGGLAVEIMATSDNVLRAGLTTKHVDPEELLAALDPAADAEVLPPGGRTGHDRHTWVLPVPEFQLTRLDTAPGVPSALPAGGGGPRIVLCTRGRLVLCTRGRSLVPSDPTNGDDAVVLTAGQSAFVPGGAPDLELLGSAEAFVAAPGPAPEALNH